jgi:hypothetical protein
VKPARTIVLLTLLLAAGLPGAVARAAYGPGADIVSVDNARDEQADDAVIAASMTPDGRYVVFQTQAENFFADNDPDPAGATRAGGIFRYDRTTGDLQLVADGNLISDADGSVLVRGASNPSISDNGRYVAFSTGQQLVAGDTNSNVDVYVRDMNVPLSPDRAAPGAYSLASAKDGADTPASYAPTPSSPPPFAGKRNPGSEVPPGTSISADGRFVAFRTVEWNSDLPAGATTDTPPGQVLVRDVLAKHTTLLTTTSQTGGATPLGKPAGGAGAAMSISADGSTVAWLGGNAPAQTRFLNGESTDPNRRYYLLRRWQGPSAATVRFSGLADASTCAAGGSVSFGFDATGPCDGPLTGTETGDNNDSLPAPALSGDGTKVAYVALGELRPPVSDFINPGFDLFYVDLASPAFATGGLKATTAEYTRAGFNPDSRATSPIDTVSMTRDGRYIGITTFRDVFTNPASCTFTRPCQSSLGTFRASADTTEGYVIDRVSRTIDRVVLSAGGGDASGSVVGPLSLSADAGLVAFVSTADNLFFGDANGVADAFVTARSTVNVKPPPTTQNERPPNFNISSGDGPKPLSVSAKRTSPTATLLTIRVAGPGAVSALARSGHAVVGRAFGTAHKAGQFRLRLSLLPHYARIVTRGKAIHATVTVTWSPKKPKTPKKGSLGVTFSSRKTRKSK